MQHFLPPIYQDIPTGPIHLLSPSSSVFMLSLGFSHSLALPVSFSLVFSAFHTKTPPLFLLVLLLLVIWHHHDGNPDSRQKPCNQPSSLASGPTRALAVPSSCSVVEPCRCLPLRSWTLSVCPVKPEFVTLDCRHLWCLLQHPLQPSSSPLLPAVGLAEDRRGVFLFPCGGSTETPLLHHHLRPQNSPHCRSAGTCSFPPLRLRLRHLP